MTRAMSLLLVARPGRMRDGLQALLRTMPEIEIVEQADTPSEALTPISRQLPVLVLLDSSLDLGEMLSLLMQVKGSCPETRCIALVENGQQQDAVTEAGADAALVTGFSTEILRATINEAVRPANKITEAEEGAVHD